MKKNCLYLSALLMMAACGSQTKSGEAVADSTAVDSVAVVDSVPVAVASPDIWSVEAVEAQIRACFDEVNRMSQKDGIDIGQLDQMFCSKDFLDLKEKLYKKVRESEGELMFDGDEGHHWTAGIGSPVTVDSVKAELLTGDQAQAEVWLKDKRGNNGYLEMNLYLEDGAWKIHNWIDDDVYPYGALFHWMQNVFLYGNSNPDEEEDDNLNNYAE